MNIFKTHKNLARFLIFLSLCGYPLLAVETSLAVHSEEVAKVIQEENSQPVVLENAPFNYVQQVFVRENLDSSNVLGLALEGASFLSDSNRLSLSTELVSSQEVMPVIFLQKLGENVSDSCKSGFSFSRILSATHFHHLGLLDLQDSGISSPSQISRACQSCFASPELWIAGLTGRLSRDAFEFAGTKLSFSQKSADTKSLLAGSPKQYRMEYHLSASRADSLLMQNGTVEFSDYANNASSRKLNLGLSKNQILGRGIFKGHSFAQARKNNLRHRLRSKHLPVFSANVVLGKSFGCVQCLFYSNGKLWGDQQQPSVNC